MLCIAFVLQNRTDWKKIISPLIIIGLTFPVINLYMTIHDAYSEKAFVRIINDSDNMEIDMIWSDNFQITYFEKGDKDEVVSFYPVYIYDYNFGIPSITDYWSYKINSVHIDLKQKNDSIITYNLPNISKGDCKTIRLTEIINKQ